MSDLLHECVPKTVSVRFSDIEVTFETHRLTLLSPIGIYNGNVTRRKILKRSTCWFPVQMAKWHKGSNVIFRVMSFFLFSECFTRLLRKLFCFYFYLNPKFFCSGNCINATGVAPQKGVFHHCPPNLFIMWAFEHYFKNELPLCCSHLFHTHILLLFSSCQVALQNLGLKVLWHFSSCI